MSRIICHHKGRYNLYSTILDSFLFVSSINLEQLKQITEEESGYRGLVGLDERLVRAHKFGNSAHFQEDLGSFLCCNRAGENEECLTTEECIKRFLS